MFLYYGIAFPSENKRDPSIAEFCANILDVNKYELVLTKNIEIPKNKKWNIPDSLDGGCTSWEYNYLLDAPQSTKEDDFELFMRKGGHFCFSANSPKRRKVEPLKTELVKGNSYLGYFLENAKESLKKYYGKRIKGQWSAQLYNSKIKLSTNFTAVITGECSEFQNIEELDKKNISSSEEVFGEYCFTEDDDKTDYWVLEKYKSNKPYLFSYSQCSYNYYHSILPDYDYFFSGPISMIVNSLFDKAKPARCMPSYYSEKMVYESYEKILWFSKKYELETDSLFGHYFNIKWNVDYDSSYVRLNASGSARFYISGFCTEEQLEIIRKRKKESSN